MMSVSLKDVVKPTFGFQGALQAGTPNVQKIACCINKKTRSFIPVDPEIARIRIISLLV